MSARTATSPAPWRFSPHVHHGHRRQRHHHRNAGWRSATAPPSGSSAASWSNNRADSRCGRRFLRIDVPWSRAWPARPPATSPSEDVTDSRRSQGAAALCVGESGRTTVRPRRRRAGRHRRPRNILTFSHGSHHCRGAAAARMQARVALTIAVALPGFRCRRIRRGVGRRPLRPPAVIVPFRIKSDVRARLAGTAASGSRERPHPRRSHRTVRQHDVSTVGMNDIARARVVRGRRLPLPTAAMRLYKAYVDREANRLYEQMDQDRRRDRRSAGATPHRDDETSADRSSKSGTVSMVHPSDSPIGAAIADRSEAIHAMVAGFWMSLGMTNPR